MAEEKPELPLTAEQIAQEITAAGVSLTADDLSALIAAARAKDRPREVALFPLKGMLPSHVSYETGRRAAARGELIATKIGGDWFVTQVDVSTWLSASGHWFADERAVQRWRASIASLDRWWNA